MKRLVAAVAPVASCALLWLPGPAVQDRARPTEASTAAVAVSDSQWVGIADLITAGLASRNVPSVSITVARHGRIVWERSFGWADGARRVEASPTTVYSLASVTKPMVATAVMTLVRAGRVDLDAPVERYLAPGLLTAYAGTTADVTIRRLLHHTAGLPQHFNYYYADEPDRPAALEKTARRFGIIVRAPGSEFGYSNLGSALLGHVVERVSGVTLSEFLAREVFAPLGMTGALFDPDLLGHRQIAVEYDNRGNVVPFHWADTPGAAHGYASARDLIRFGMFHLEDHLEDQRAILDDRLIELMRTEGDGTVHPDGSGETYGLGWFASGANDSRVVWHEGGWEGASAMLKLVPSEDAAVAVLMNVFDQEFVHRIADSALRVLLPDWKAPQPLASEQPSQRAIPPFPMPAGTYTGTIRTSVGDVPLVLTMTEQGDLSAQLGDPASASRPVQQVPAFVPRSPGHLLVWFPGPLGDPDADRHDHVINLDLSWVRGELVGVASAMALDGIGNAATDHRMHFSLPYWVVLRAGR
jgi:CubicO group peptidase (beta-lactamase class C family)